MKNLSKVMWGLILIILGLIIALNSLGLANIDIFFSGWWTLFIIVPSLINLLSGRNVKDSCLWLIIGIVLLLAAQDFISFRLVLKLIVPFIIVFIGVSIVLDGMFDDKVKKHVDNAKVQDLESIVGMFADEKRVIDYEFKGAVIDTAFGHVLLDIRDAKIKDEATIKVSSIFGGVDLRVPDDVEVKVKANRVFGGVENLVKSGNRKGNKNEKVKTIYVEAFAMFGGINIK